jgi:transposase-like protein
MSARPKRSFSREFKLQVVRQLLNGEKRLAQLCREYDLGETLVRHWREQYEQKGENVWPEQPPERVGADPLARIAALEAALGRAHLEIEFLRRALELLEKRGSPSERNGR